MYDPKRERLIKLENRKGKELPKERNRKVITFCYD